MDDHSPKEAIERFHQWRQELLLPGHLVVEHAEQDPQLVLSSKMLKVFLELHPQYRAHMGALQVHFLDQDYTNRVKPEAWEAVTSDIANR